MISSKNNTVIIDRNNNKIFLEKFEYHTESNIFKSVGYVKINDNLDNTYEFSQIYIDTNKKELLGTDIKAYLNDESFKINEKNKPRIFANTLRIDEKKSSLEKVYSPYVTIEKKINVLLGLFNRKRCFTIVKKRQSIMIMQS